MYLAKFLNQPNLEEIRNNLKKNGYYIIDNVYDKNFCDKIIEFMDAHPESTGGENIEIHYGGTEVRIWDVQKRDERLQQFYIENNDFLSSILKRPSTARTLLAIRNKPLKENDELSKKGRWHLDSFKSQLKTFLFLSDTTELSGPFEFIPDTQKIWFKIKMLIAGKYFKPSDFFQKKKSRSYQRLHDNLIEKMKLKGYLPVPIICKAGTLLIVNTSAIHRARPCIQGARYALTTYY